MNKDTGRRFWWTGKLNLIVRGTKKRHRKVDCEGRENNHSPSKGGQ
uniref:Uncharacterized protein n=1 Tax=Anguilla anguilla TaxID=7936 RepID=A0A0E9WRX9_ANGAN